MWSFALDGGPAPLDDVSPVDGRSPGSTADALEQRAAAEALSLSAKALRMTLQKIGGAEEVGVADDVCAGGNRPTPWKINIEPENHWVVKENSLLEFNFQVPCSSSRV